MADAEGPIRGPHGMLGHSRQHPRADFVLIVKRELVVRPLWTGQEPVRTALALHSQADPL